MAHKLSKIDAEQRKGTCEMCGKVDLHVVGRRKDGSLRFACAEAKKLRARNFEPRRNRVRVPKKPKQHILTNIDENLGVATCRICGPNIKARFLEYRNSWRCEFALQKINIARYNFSEPVDFNAEYKKQKGRCKICRKRKKLIIEHCHETGKFRGLVCKDCNLVLGFSKDNVHVLIRAAIYLTESRE